MIAQVRSELRKMGTTRTNLGLLFGLVALILVGVIGGAFSSEADLSLLENQRELIGNGSFAAAFAALVGIMAMTSEFRHGTIRATFVFTPDRTRVIAGRQSRASRSASRSARSARRSRSASASSLIHARGYDLLVDRGDVRQLVIGTIAMSAFWAAIGVGIGALLRNQVFAIVGLFAWVFVLEVILFQYLPGVARYAPGAAGTAMTGDTVGDSSVHLLGAVAGGAVLAAYAAALVVSGTLLTNRRDVT